MPIHDLGYRAWQGQTTPESSRFWVITQTGVRLAWANRWLRRLVPVGWVPALYLGIAFFLLEQALAFRAEMEQAFAGPGRPAQAFSPRGEMRMLFGFLGQFPDAQSVLGKVAAGDPAEARPEAWRWLMCTYLRIYQGMVMILVIGLVAPPLVAKDVHSRAFLLYFSRPLARLEYILGKLLVICGYVLLVTMVPALVLYLFGVLLAPPEAAVLGSTWDLPLRILLASAVLIIPASVLALALSSTTTRTFYAGFAWFAVWFLGWVALSVVRANVAEPSEHWSLLSLYHTLGKAVSWVFGMPVVSGSDSIFADAMPSLVLIGVVTLVSIVVVFRRVSSPMRI